MSEWWASELLDVEDNRLVVAGVDAEEWAGRHGTPVFIYGRKRVEANLGRLRAAFRGVEDGGRELRIAYAMKANAHHGLLRLLEKNGTWIDAVSPGEVAAARKAGFPAERIVYTGTSVSDGDLRSGIGTPGLMLTIDSVEQVAAMAAIRRSLRPKGPVRVSVRMNPGVGSGFNPKVITAGGRSSDGTPIKFGVEERRLLEAFRAAKAAGFRPVGLHQHLGSGWVLEDFPTVRTAVDRMVDAARRLRRAGFPLEVLDFGGGFGPRYSEDQHCFPLEEYGAHIAAAVAGSGLDLRAVTIEPGKYLVGDAGVLLLRVGYVKENYGNAFACVDGGTYNSVPRPVIYPRAYHQIVNASRVRAARGTAKITVAGDLCETGDVFAKECPMPRPKRGDLLAVLCAGAYCRSMASNYNQRPIPREILV